MVKILWYGLSLDKYIKFLKKFTLIYEQNTLLLLNVIKTDIYIDS